MTAYVYRVYDLADRLLYVGSTVNVEERLKAHSKTAHWWVFKGRVEHDVFDTRDEASAAEARAIQSEHPRWNVRDRSPEHPDGYSITDRGMTWLDYEKSVARDLRKTREQVAALTVKYRLAALRLRSLEETARSLSEGRVSVEFDLDEELA